MTETNPVLARIAQDGCRADHSPQTPCPLPVKLRDAALAAVPLRAVSGQVRHSFKLGDQLATLDMPQDTITWILDPLGISCPIEARQRELVLELACLEMIDLLEKALDVDIAATDAEAPAQAFGLEIAAEDGPRYLTLYLSDPLAAAFHDYLENNHRPKAAPDLSQQSVPVKLRLGQQFLTAIEIAQLSSGDVILLEKGPAVLIAAQQAAAAIDITVEGVVMRSEFRTLPDEPDRPELQIVFDIAHRDMTLADLAALAPGDPLDIAVFADTGVDIAIAGDRIIGRGHPITLGDEAGIRIQKIFETATDL